MLKMLVANACILVTFIFISSQFFKNIDIDMKSPFKYKALLGFLGGISTIVLISYSIPISAFSVLDFRHLIEILVAILGGIIPSIITGSIDALYRLLYNGIDQSSIIASIGILILSIGCGLISMIHIARNTKILAMLFYSLTIRSVVYFLLNNNKSIILESILILWVSSIIIGAGVYYLVRYLIISIKLMKSLKDDSHLDLITGLKNTRAFDYNYNRMVNSTVSEEKALSFLMIDIDHFKKINDTYGHVAGDEVLKDFGNVLVSTFRDIDLVSRIGGEEFTAILKDLNSEKTLEIAERLRKNIETHIFYLNDSSKIKLTASIGIAIYPDTVGDINNLKEMADNKLYEAKKTGRNKICI